MILGACCIAGAALVFSMMGGDYCVDPDTYTTQMTSLASSQSTYYLNCEAPYPTFYAQVTELIEATELISENIMAAKTEVTDTSYSCQLRLYIIMTPYLIRKLFLFVCQYIV